jgi:tryptophan synthase alpha chain
MNRLQKLFADKPSNLLSVFYTAGFPKLDSTVAIGKSLALAGADIIEIGIPFSDPVADGPAIQESNKVALDNGMNLHLLLRQVKQLRQEVSVPIILMGYLNPVLQYGFEEFCFDCASGGVDGLILPDLPLDVYLKEYKVLVENSKLSMTFLISPTTSEERIRVIDSHTNSFIYAVSASSTTGVKQGFADEQLTYFKRIQALKLKHPYMIGFGISNHETFKTASVYSSGAIVGSAFINMLKSSTNLEADVAEFVRRIKGNQ